MTKGSVSEESDPSARTQASLGPRELMVEGPGLQSWTLVSLTPDCRGVGGVTLSRFTDKRSRNCHTAESKPPLSSPTLSCSPLPGPPIFIKPYLLVLLNIYFDSSQLTSSPGLLPCSQYLLTCPQLINFLLSKSFSFFKVHFKFHLHERFPILPLILLISHLHGLPPGPHIWPTNYIHIALYAIQC